MAVSHGSDDGMGVSLKRGKIKNEQSENEAMDKKKQNAWRRSSVKC